MARLVDVLVLLLFKFFRAVEWISVNVSRTGRFNEASSRRSPISYQSLSPHQQRSTWLLSLTYPPAFHGFLYMACGAALMVVGYSVIWLEYVHEWWAGSEVLATVRMQFLYHSPILIDPIRHPFYLTLAAHSLRLGILFALCTAALTLAPKILALSPKIHSWRRCVSRWEVLWLTAVTLTGLSTLILQHYNTVMNEEILYIIFPVSLGAWLWVAAGWGLVGRWLVTRREGERARDVEREGGLEGVERSDKRFEEGRID